MTDMIDTPLGSSDVAGKVAESLTRRYAAERRFKAYGLIAVGLALGFLAVMMSNIIYKGHTAFMQTFIGVEIEFDVRSLDPTGALTQETLGKANYLGLLKTSLRNQFPEVSGRREKRRLYKLVSGGAATEIRAMLLENPGMVGLTKTIWVTASDDVDMLIKGNVNISLPEDQRRLKDLEISWIETLQQSGLIESRFNTTFFTSGDSRDPEQAGILGAFVGSVLTLLVTLTLSFPIGVMAAVYLEEFAPKNRLTQIIEVNINNLAAVPSIVFGLLGLAVLLNFLHLPRSAPLVGGMVLTLMTLPTIIIAGRAALRAVPPSIREAALGVGASKLQMVTDHVLPLAMPGMLTGAVIGMAQALGETAPLLMIGMVAFIVDVPAGLTDPATVLPVQVYLWADSPERAFAEKTSAAIMVLLVFLVLMNLLAQVLRRKFENKW